MSLNGLEYYISPNYFFAGKNCTEYETLSSYHIRDPLLYVMAWMEMSNRGTYFVGDGDCFSDKSFWEPLVLYGLSVVVVNCCCDVIALQKRQHYCGRGMPLLWKAINKRYQLLTSWISTSVKHIAVDTYNHSAFSIIHNTIIPFLLLNIPTEESSLQTFNCNGTIYKVYKHLLPTHVFQFLVYYAQQQVYMKEEGVVHGVLRSKPRGLRLEGNMGCGICYCMMSVDPLCLHPMLRYAIYADVLVVDDAM